MARKPPLRTKPRARPRIRYLQQWRKNRGFSQEELAARVGLTQGMISQLETGTSDYTGTLLESLAKALDCDPLDLQGHNPSSGESPYTLIERMDDDDRARALEVLKALRRTP